MNPSRETHESTSAEGGEGSDQSMSDSWTVLDSSHFKDDGDLSDAESVEVLASDEAATDDVCSEVKFYEPLSAETSNCSVDCSKSILEAPKSGEGDSVPEETHVFSEDVSDETNSASENRSNNNTSPPKKHFFLNGAPFEIIGESFSAILLALAIYSLIVDLFILSYFGFSSMAGIFEKPGSSLVKMTSSHLQYEMDPLALQLSHVLAEWKKRPQEDHSLDRHVLKTLLLYYGGSTELSATLHSLTAKVQKHNEFIRQRGKDWQMDLQPNHFIVSGHIAHSVACILGKQDNDKFLPENLFTAVNNTREKANSDFTPEPTFWLNDWKLPQYFKANDTYYRLESKTVSSPLRSLFLNLGSSKWNQYFWKLYHEEAEGTKIKGKGVFQAQENRISENELESEEETERSPLEVLTTGDMIAVEESSGNVQSSDENVEEVHVFPQFLIDEDFKEADVEEKEQSVWDGNYFEVLDGEEFLGSNGPLGSRYVCLDDGCRPYKAMKADESQKVESKGKLSQLFEELALDEAKVDEDAEDTMPRDWVKPDHPLQDAWTQLNAKPDNPESDWTEFENPFEDPWINLHAGPDKINKKSKLAKLFGELSLDESQNEDVFIGRYVDSPQNAEFANLLGDIQNDDDVLEKKGIDSPKKGKLAMLFEELALDDSLEQTKENDEVADYPAKEIKSKLKRKYKVNKYDMENPRGKGKQKKKKGKGKGGLDNGNSMGKKKMKKRNNFKNDLHVEPEMPKNNVMSKHSDNIDLSDKYSFEGKNADWNTRMAQGREKLRALSEKGDDNIWWVERTKARRAMREETFSQ